MIIVLSLKVTLSKSAERNLRQSHWGFVCVVLFSALSSLEVCDQSLEQGWYFYLSLAFCVDKLTIEAYF